MIHLLAKQLYHIELETSLWDFPFPRHRGEEVFEFERVDDDHMGDFVKIRMSERKGTGRAHSWSFGDSVDYLPQFLAPVLRGGARAVR